MQLYKTIWCFVALLVACSFAVENGYAVIISGAVLSVWSMLTVNKYLALKGVQ
jgi:hypothetical protein